jgi:hypothetical protein
MAKRAYPRLGLFRQVGICAQRDQPLAWLTATLDSVVPAALLGLSEEQAHEVKRAIANVMGE